MKPQGPSVAPSERLATDFEHASLLGTVRELRTTDFKQVRPRLVRARRAGLLLDRSKLHRAHHKKRIQANSVHDPLSELLVSILSSHIRLLSNCNLLDGFEPNTNRLLKLKVKRHGVLSLD